MGTGRNGRARSGSGRWRGESSVVQYILAITRVPLSHYVCYSAILLQFNRVFLHPRMPILVVVLFIIAKWLRFDIRHIFTQISSYLPPFVNHVTYVITSTNVMACYVPPAGAGQQLIM